MKKKKTVQETFTGIGLLLFTCRGVNATLELVPEERSLTVDFPPQVMLCFCSVLCCVQQNKTIQRLKKKNCSQYWSVNEPLKGVYLEGFGDSGFGGLVDLSLSNAPTAALPQLTETEAQILLICIIFNLQHHIRK